MGSTIRRQHIARLLRFATVPGPPDPPKWSAFRKASSRRRHLSGEARIDLEFWGRHYLWLEQMIDLLQACEEGPRDWKTIDGQPGIRELIRRFEEIQNCGD